MLIPHHRVRARRRPPWVQLAAVLFALGLAATATACSDDDGAPDPDAGLDAGPDAATGPTEPQPIAITQWVGASRPSDSDPVQRAIEAGTFTLPAAGTSYLGLNWTRLETGDEGRIARANVGVFYAAADIEVPAGHRVFARSDSVYTLFVDNEIWQPGDTYHTRRHRVPLGIGEGTHTVVALAYARSNAAEVELYHTDAEILLNTQDVTQPHLRVGRTDDLYLGVATVHLVDTAALDVTAAVLDSTAFEATAVNYPFLAPEATTQVSFVLRPKASAVASADSNPLAWLRLSSPSWRWTYEAQVSLTTADATEPYRQTRRSDVDGSTQFYGVQPPPDPEAPGDRGLILSLHGAGVDGLGQARSYAPKDWAWVVAPTNRRPFGFNWEAWGRLDALEALDHALHTLPIDPERVHLGGHSMGGHGTWHVGVHYPHRFGVIAPSAAWIDWEAYQSVDLGTGPWGRAKAALHTLDFVDNLAPRTVYIIHGEADDNVPVSHGRQMHQTLQPIVADLTYHEEPGAGHWWDSSPDVPGTDCVDLPAMMNRMETARLDRTPLSFHVTLPGPWVSPTHSFVTLRSALSPMENLTVDASRLGDTVTLVTHNVRSLVLDGQALADAGIATVVVDGASHAVTAGDLPIGPQDGKRPDLHGPVNQVFYRPFCFVYHRNGPALYRRLAAYLLSSWNLTGNGHGCALATDELPAGFGETTNLVFLGVAPEDIPGAPALPFHWDDDAITVGTRTFTDTALVFVYPQGDRLHGYFTATAGSERLLFRFVPFDSPSGAPDFFLFGVDGGVANGFFDATWQVDPAYATGL